MVTRSTTSRVTKPSTSSVTGVGVSSSSGGESAPVNTIAPVISGTLVVGEDLSVTTGTWTGTPTITYGYQWRRNNSDIGGATNSTYTLVQADAGNVIDCVVTATNGVGSDTATSDDTTTIYDADANTYLAAVETADTEALESGVRLAINSFVIGCKSDAIWDDILCLQLLCGARTLSGAMVPLKGTGPTNFNFVSGDYSRTLGLKGNASTKYLASNFSPDDAGTNDGHFSVYLCAEPTTLSCLAGIYSASPAYFNYIYRFTSGTANFSINSTNQKDSVASAGAKFFGVSKSLSGSFNYRFDGTQASHTVTAATASAADLNIFRRNRTDAAPDNYTDARIGIYTAGTAIDMGLLRAREVTLVTAIGAALA